MLQNHKPSSTKGLCLLHPALQHVLSPAAVNMWPLRVIPTWLPWRFLCQHFTHDIHGGQASNSATNSPFYTLVLFGSLFPTSTSSGQEVARSLDSLHQFYQPCGSFSYEKHSKKIRLWFGYAGILKKPKARPLQITSNNNRLIDHISEGQRFILKVLQFLKHWKVTLPPLHRSKANLKLLMWNESRTCRCNGFGVLNKFPHKKDPSLKVMSYSWDRKSVV